MLTERRSAGITDAAMQRAGSALPKALATTGIVLAVFGAAMLFLSTGSRRPPSDRHPVADGHGTPWFIEVAQESGIDFRHVSGHETKFYFPEIMSGGVCLLDYDGDGHLDVYFVQGGRVEGAAPETPGNRLFRNNGDATFTDVTASAAVGDTGYGMGCACGDVDSDGWTDIYVTNAGPNVLYRNNGDGTFADVSSQAGVDDPGFSASAAFADFDRDGHLDLFVTNYIRWSPATDLDCVGPDGRLDYCTPEAYAAPAPDRLYRNNGDGTFTDATQSAGIFAAFGNGLGAVWADFNDDGGMDIALANDLTANQLWINQGDGTFVDEALIRGAAYNIDGVAESGMGIDAQDVDGDGALDLFMTHFEGQTNTLYINREGFFFDESRRAGLGVSAPYTGFGTALIDLDNDGRLDIFVVNGRVVVGRGRWAEYGPYAEPNQLLAGVGDGTFREVTPIGGTAQRLVDSSRGAAFGDYDDDGRVDIFVCNRDGPAYLLKNIVAEGNHWIRFRVLRAHGSDALGARVEISVAGQRRVRDVRAAYSYCASSDPKVHFGLGAATKVDKVRVRWADGTWQDFGPFAADQTVELRPR